jgi:(E)-4-hydroxy-3-methylbut-2-enyl-diphosphate synthase
MGCVVNGPGEMADADYGYVGGAKGTVTLYKGREAIRKNIPESTAVEELIKLITDYGDWTDPVNA